MNASDVVREPTSGVDPLCAFRLPPDMRAALDAAAEAEGTSMSAVIRTALAEYLKARELVST